MSEPAFEIPDDPEELRKRLELAMKAINKQYGPGTIMQPGREEPQPIPSVSTGAITLDNAIGIGGLPFGRVIEVWGQESSGKSTLAISVVAEAQKAGHICAYLDIEQALDSLYARELGMDIDNILLSQPDYGEQALDIVEDLIKTGIVNVIVVDSVAALTPKAELEGTFDDQHMAQLPRMMSKAMRKLVPLVRQHNVCLLFINQLRASLNMYGPKTVQPGGNALKFAASVRMELAREGDYLKEKDGTVKGFRVRAKVVKNKVGPPFRIGYYDLIYGEGIDKVGCLLDAALTAGIFEMGGGGYYKFKGETYAQGRAAALEKLKSEPETIQILKDTLNATI